MKSPHDIGRESWVWGEQGALERRYSPHKVGEEALAEWIPSSAIKRSNPWNPWMKWLLSLNSFISQFLRDLPSEIAVF